MSSLSKHLCHYLINGLELYLSSQKRATDLRSKVSLIAESGDSKSKKFLFARIFLAIQRGNTASILGTFPDSAILSEIFVL
jgi:hypothetical protein